MPEQLWFTQLLNQHLAGVVTPLLQRIGLAPRYPDAPITNFVAMELLVFLILIVFFVLVRVRLSVDRPGGLQHIMEAVEGFVNNQSEEIIGHHSEGFTPFLVVLGLFILIGNLIGLIPGFESPTASGSVPLGCAILTFFYYNFHGIRKQGLLKYLKHFTGPMPALAPLMLPIELFSHGARVLSLTLRLYANMFAGDMVTLVFMSLIPVLVPVVFLGLHIFVSLLQAYIFVLLTTVYLAGAVAEEH
ncbi:MAG TPA: F0F1 ATP synthase subunit A [Terriglobales bacterium]|jgi:F-type H+-transporting ATPase subunit a|nr:F0F1 ATP synthase subunit A [Terriglobales bacterium]